MNWNERIKQLREEKKLKPAAFAKLVGVSGATISDWESGVIKQISGKHLVKAAAALGITPEWIMTGQGCPDGRPQPTAVISEEQHHLWALWGDLFDHQRVEHLDRISLDVEKNRVIVQELEKKQFRMNVSEKRVHKTSFNHPDWRKKDIDNG